MFKNVAKYNQYEKKPNNQKFSIYFKLNVVNIFTLGYGCYYKNLIFMDLFDGIR